MEEWYARRLIGELELCPGARVDIVIPVGDPLAEEGARLRITGVVQTRVSSPFVDKDFIEIRVESQEERCPR